MPFIHFVFIYFEKRFDPDQALHLRPDQDPNCLTLCFFFLICFRIVIKLICVQEFSEHRFFAFILYVQTNRRINIRTYASIHRLIGDIFFATKGIAVWAVI